MEAEIEAAKKLGVSGEPEKLKGEAFNPPPTISEVARQRISLLCLIHLGVTAGAALLQIMAVISVGSISIVSCYYWHGINYIKEPWSVTLVSLFFIINIPSVLAAAFVFRRKMLGVYFDEKFQVCKGWKK